MINPTIPSEIDSLAPHIMVVGVGGAGGNALNNMIAANLQGVNYMVCNTDNQALRASLADQKIQLGPTITRGLGAGGKFEVGRASAEESINEIMSHLDSANMVFVTAGMGGGTGTGAAPVIARAARERGILTVGVVTKPFHFEGSVRMRQAEEGIRELQQYVDTLIVIPNQNLFRVAKEDTTFANAFKMADEVLQGGVRGITDVIVLPGIVNRDFNDVKTIMSEMGKAMLGTGEAEGPGRALKAAEAAISNPLLDDASMKGAKGVLICVSGGDDITLYEMDEVTNRIRDEVDSDANIIWGTYLDTNLQGRIRVSLIATGIDSESMARPVTTAGAMTMKPIAVAPIVTVPTRNVAPIETRTSVAAQNNYATQTYAQPQQQTATFGSHAGQAAANAARAHNAQSYASAAAVALQNSAAQSMGQQGMSQQGMSQQGMQQTQNYQSVPNQFAPHQSVGSAALQMNDEFETSSFDHNVPAQSQSPWGQPQNDMPRVQSIPLSVGARPAGADQPQVIARMDLLEDESAHDMHQQAEPRSARPEAVKRKGPSLFERVTGLTHARAPAAETSRQPAQRQPSVAPQQNVAMDQSSAAAQMAGTHLAQPAPHLNLRPQTQPMPQGAKLAQGEEDLLDIPTFLRRQAN